MPFEFAESFPACMNVSPHDKAIISVHTHDDLDSSRQLSLAAVHAGARQVEGAMNGIGERTTAHWKKRRMRLKCAKTS